jgi:hypothetical protein
MSVWTRNYVLARESESQRIAVNDPYSTQTLYEAVLLLYNIAFMLYYMVVRYNELQR